MKTDLHIHMVSETPPVVSVRGPDVFNDQPEIHLTFTVANDPFQPSAWTGFDIETARALGEALLRAADEAEAMIPEPEAQVA